MEQVIELPHLNKSFSVEVTGGTFKDATNRSFSNASPCCKKELKQDKKCSACGNTVANSEVTEKIIKIGKQTIILPADRLKGIQEDIESRATGINVKAVVKKAGFDIPMDRIDGGKYCSPANKRVKDFVELRELCKDFVLIAEATFKSNTYEVLVMTVNNNLVILKLAAESRMYKSPDLSGVEDIAVNPAVIEVEKQILGKVAVAEHDFTTFKDLRAEQVDSLIEAVALGGELPVFESKVEAAVKQEEDELERLKALLVQVK